MLQPLNNQIAIPLSKWLVCAINGQTVLMRSPIYPKSGLILCTGKITSSVDSLLRDESISFPFPGYLLRAHHLLSSLKSQHLYSQQSLFLRKTSRMFLEILTEEKIWILFFSESIEALSSSLVEWMVSRWFLKNRTSSLPWWLFHSQMEENPQE